FRCCRCSCKRLSPTPRTAAIAPDISSHLHYAHSKGGVRPMKCPACGHENEIDAAFCGGCGRAMRAAKACASCGREARSDERFCQGCGSQLGTASPEQSAGAATPPLPSSFAGGRYGVRRFLGEGAKKRVYLAHDTKLDRDVAFALIKTDGLDADGL